MKILNKDEFTIETTMTIDEVLDKLKNNTQKISKRFLFLNSVLDNNYPFYGSFEDQRFKLHTTANAYSHMYMTFEGNIKESFEKTHINVKTRGMSRFKLFSTYFSIIPLGIVAYVATQTLSNYPNNFFYSLFAIVFFGDLITSLVISKKYLNRAKRDMYKIFNK